MGKHTILLVQPNPSPASRTFSDFPTINEAADGKGLSMAQGVMGGWMRAAVLCVYCALCFPPSGGLSYVPYDRSLSHPHHAHSSPLSTHTAVVKMYETQLKQLNPRVKHITYSIEHLLKFVDDLVDISALV